MLILSLIRARALLATNSLDNAPAFLENSVIKLKVCYRNDITSISERCKHFEQAVIETVGDLRIYEFSANDSFQMYIETVSIIVEQAKDFHMAGPGEEQPVTGKDRILDALRQHNRLLSGIDGVIHRQSVDDSMLYIRARAILLMSVNFLEAAARALVSAKHQRFSPKFKVFSLDLKNTRDAHAMNAHPKWFFLPEKKEMLKCVIKEYKELYSSGWWNSEGWRRVLQKKALLEKAEAKKGAQSACVNKLTRYAKIKRMLRRQKWNPL